MSSSKYMSALPPPYSEATEYPVLLLKGHRVLPSQDGLKSSSKGHIVPSSKSYTFTTFAYKSAPKPRNRSLSLRSSSKNKGGEHEGRKHKFGLSSLRSSTKPELSKRLYRLIKSENHVIGSHDAAGREQISIASQLSEWGLSTNDDGVSDVSDKIGVLLSELGETEIRYGQNLEDYRSVLKQIRNTEASVQPSRDNKAKITDEIARLKYKEPQSVKIPTLEQELVRAEAENLVAEAQLTNITRQKIKEAYAFQFAAIIERSEKQAILAKHGRRLLNILDDTPVVPGDARPAYDLESEARQILNDAEAELQSWTLNVEEVTTNAHLDPALMPMNPGASHVPQVSQYSEPAHSAVVTSRQRRVSASSSSSSEYAAAPTGHQTTVLHGTGQTGEPPYPVEGSTRVTEHEPAGPTTTTA